MLLKLKNKVAFVSGSSRGIGKSIAKMLIKEGCKVIINGRKIKDLKKTSNELNNCTYITGDVTDPDNAKKIIKRIINDFGKLDILICNVGNGSSLPPNQENFNEWKKMLSINFLSATNCIEAAKENLISSKGVIVCISSICGLNNIHGAPLTYSSSKAALNSYIKGISFPLGKKNVRINAIAPGNIIFKDSVWSKKIKEDPAKVNLMLKNQVALSKLGKPEDVANLTLFLCSDLANFITGKIFAVDGGQIS